MKYLSVLLCVLSINAWSSNEVTYAISIANETVKLAPESQLQDAHEVGFAYADENIDRPYRGGYNAVFVDSNASSVVIKLRAEKNNYGAHFSYFFMHHDLPTTQGFLTINNPVGDVSNGDVTTKLKIKASGYRVGFHYIAKPKKLISYGPLAGIEFWQTQHTTQNNLTYEEDDGAILNLVGSIITTEKSRTVTINNSGYSPYLGGFVRLTYKRFQVGIDAHFFSQSDFAYQSAGLHLGYQF